jgi:hypothetical protein
MRALPGVMQAVCPVIAFTTVQVVPTIQSVPSGVHDRPEVQTGTSWPESNTGSMSQNDSLPVHVVTQQ